MRTFTLLIATLIAGGIAMSGCGDNIESVSAAECASTRKWVGDDSGDPGMHPGRDCIGCHNSGGDGPSFYAAGTVYGADKQADDCLGVAGAVIEITDKNGVVHRMSSNDSGNFYTKDAITPPYTAKVIVGTKERVMGTPQTTGACNSCHTQAGANGAPGRILLPQ
ncbi:MAG: hypothetical protein U0165_15335 [Polyangiaceae bacterium]